MKKFCPQVNTIDVQKKLLRATNLNNLETFSKFNITKEDKKAYSIKKEQSLSEI